MSEEPLFSKLNAIPGCPICQGKLELGYVLAGSGIHWTRKKQQRTLFGAKALKSMWAADIPRCPAMKCEKCEIAIIDYQTHIPAAHSREFMKWDTRPR